MRPEHCASGIWYLVCLSTSLRKACLHQVLSLLNRYGYCREMPPALVLMGSLMEGMAPKIEGHRREWKTGN
jgi:hypothetical protein